jgi:hypothetical protein
MRYQLGPWCLIDLAIDPSSTFWEIDYISCFESLHIELVRVGRTRGRKEICLIYLGQKKVLFASLVRMLAMKLRDQTSGQDIPQLQKPLLVIHCCRGLIRLEKKTDCSP